jgi:general secretion pathway protein K
VSRGFALLIVLWSLVLVSLLVTGITSAGRGQLLLASNLRRAAAAEAAADGGVAEAIFYLSEPSAAAWRIDGVPHTIRIGQYALEVRVTDEAAFLNPNTARPELLAALMTALGVDPSRAASLAQAIADWRTPGAREPVIQRYRSSSMATAPTGQNFRSVDELRFVIGMTPDLLARLKPHLSVFAFGPLQVSKADGLIQAALRSLGDSGLAISTSSSKVVDITVDARGSDQTRFVRHAIISLSAGTTDPPYSTLLWEGGMGQ